MKAPNELKRALLILAISMAVVLVGLLLKKQSQQLSGIIVFLGSVLNLVAVALIVKNFWVNRSRE